MQSGHYQRHLQRHLPMFKYAREPYELELPIDKKEGPGRTTMQFHVLLPQEEIEEELSEVEDWQDKLKVMIARKELPQCYEDHPIVQRNAQEPVLPLAMFIDGVPYSKIDEIEGIWVINMLTNRRHFCVGLRKLLKCKCGCKGWCTHWEIFNFLKWVYESFAEGKMPSRRHDNREWYASDKERLKAAGKPITKAALIFLKSDWMELPHFLESQVSTIR